MLTRNAIAVSLLQMARLQLSMPFAPRPCRGAIAGRHLQLHLRGAAHGRALLVMFIVFMKFMLLLLGARALHKLGVSVAPCACLAHTYAARTLDAGQCLLWPPRTTGAPASRERACALDARAVASAAEREQTAQRNMAARPVPHALHIPRRAVGCCSDA